MAQAVLKLVEKKTNKTAIESLERLLELAKQGEVIGLSGVYFFADGRVGYSHLGECARKPNTTINTLHKLCYKILPDHKHVEANEGQG